MSRPPVNPENSSPDPSPHGFGSQSGKEPKAPPAALRPRAILVIALIVGAEATALLVAAGWYGFELATAAPVRSFWGAVFTLGLLLAFSAWLYCVAYYLFRGYRWTRAAALIAQLFVLTIGFPTLTGGVVVAGIAMLVPSLVGIVLLFDKRVIAYASRTGGAPRLCDCWLREWASVIVGCVIHGAVAPAAERSRMRDLARWDDRPHSPICHYGP